MDILSRTVIGLGLALMASDARAQSYEVEMYPYQLMQTGSWSVPYVLPLEDDNKGEIAHLALLPPAIDKTGTPWVTIPAAPRVFLACEFGAGPQSYGLTHLWNPQRPGAVVPIPAPTGYPTDGSQDFFCGGHTFLFDGRFLLVNGTDSVPEMPCTLATGHDDAWVLDTHEANPTWIHATGATKPLKRWYPTATALGDQSVMVHGHTGCPLPAPDGQGNDAVRDRFTWHSATATGTWGEAVAGLHPGNTRLPPDCTIPVIKLRLFDYPRLHLASTGELVWTAAFNEFGSPNDPVRSWFMNVAIPDCPISLAPLRWRQSTLPGAIPQLHNDGSSVHLITWDKDTGAFTESFYLIGGANKGIAGAPEACNGATISAGVERMTRVLVQGDPAWDDATWETVASLNTPRVNHNTVILLDGSLLVVGGVACDGGAFTFPLQAERYMPKEVLDSPPATPLSAWIPMASQELARGYHSGAIMLPNGDVVSGGGKAEESAKHAIEVYTPGWGKVTGLTRPAIDASTIIKDPANDAYTYTGPPFSFDVTLAPNKTVNRVALIRNGSSTHAFNPDQRYVELARPDDPGDVQLSTTPNIWRLTVLAPPNGAMAPPGYYLLTVVDNAGVPSPAEWIRIAAEEGPAGP